MRSIFRIGAVASAFAAVSLTAFGATSASGTISLVSASGGIYNYDLKLSDTGTTNIGTFWFAWVPGEDFLPTKPTSASAPTGWAVNKITNSGSSDGYAIRWEAPASTALKAGQSIDGFMFSSTDSFKMIQGNSPFYPNTPILTSFVYERGPFQGGNFQFQVAPVPEPSLMLTMGLGAFGFLLRKKKRS